MTYQKKSRIVILTSIIFVMVYSIFLAKIEFFDAREKIVVANGVVTGKYESDYSCGTRGKYTCYARYLIIDGKNHSVDIDTFVRKNIDDSVVLTIDGSSLLSKKEVIIMFIGFIFWFVFFLFLTIRLILFMWWSFFYSDEISFSDFLD